jgi:hypothetical protein
LRGFCHWQGRFEQHYRIGAGSVESGEKGKLGRMEFRLLATAMADIFKI